MIRFLAMHPMQMMYEVRSPTLDRLRMTLKAVLEPMTMSEMRTVKTMVTVHALRGMSMPGRTCKSQFMRSSRISFHVTHSTEECRRWQTTVSGEREELSRSRGDLVDSGEEQQNTDNRSETRCTSFRSHSVVEDLQILLVLLVGDSSVSAYLDVPLTELSIENRLHRASKGKH
jgi:hypothetical protein